MIEVKRRKGESFESLVRRFRKQMQASGTLIQAKKVQYHRRSKSKNLTRVSTLVRLARKQALAYKEKVGKLVAVKTK